jgi:hypothetical protein
MMDPGVNDESVVFRPSRVLNGMELLVGWVVIAFLFVLAPTYTGFPIVLRLIFYLFAAIFGMLSIVNVINLLPGAVELRLTQTGYIRKTMFREMPERSWKNYREFAAVAPFRKGILSVVGLLSLTYWRKYVMWNYSDAFKQTVKMRLTNTDRLEKWERRLAKTRKRTGYEKMLMYKFGRRTEEVAEQMEAFRRRAAEQPESVS